MGDMAVPREVLKKVVTGKGAVEVMVKGMAMVGCVSSGDDGGHDGESAGIGA